MSHRPFVSVVIPARDEAATLADAVRSVIRQAYDGPIEVLVAVGPSTDRTRECADRLARADERVRVVDNRSGTTPAGLNAGIAASRGDLIARVDGHGWIAPDYLAVGVATLERTGADAVGGVVRFVGQGAMGRAIAIAQASRVGAGTARFRTATTETVSDGLSWGIFRRELFQRVGLFDEDMLRNQDDEFCHRIRLAGGRMIVTPSMRFWSQSRSSLPALGRQYADWGLYRMHTFSKHGPAAPRQLVPPLLVGLFVAAGAIDLATGGRRSVSRNLASAYTVAIGVGAASAAARDRQPELAPLVAVASMTMHLSYGFGFWRAVAGRVWPALGQADATGGAEPRE